MPHLKKKQNKHPKAGTRLSSLTLQSHLKSTNEWKQNNDLFRRGAGTAVGMFPQPHTHRWPELRIFFQSEPLSLEEQISENL